MLRITASLSTIMLAILLSSFQLVYKHERPAPAPLPGNDSIPLSDCSHELYEYFYTSSSRYNQYCDSVYCILFGQGNQPSRSVFNYAMKGHAYLSGQNLLAKSHLLAFIDYSLSSNIKRLWVVDLGKMSLVYHELVAHGRNTGEEYARKFSNKENSYQTSLGFFITGEIYNGKHETSVKMNGVEQKFNGRAFDRGIVMHGADYVSEQFIRQHQRLGRSLGCPAVSQEVISKLSSTICDGVCLFAYYPNKSYLKSSTILKSDVVMAVAR
jgi:hypothetical protein